MKISKYLIPKNYVWFVTMKCLNFCFPKGKIKILQTNYTGVEILIRANEDVGKAVLAKRFERKELDYIKKQLPSNAIFLDIGSNIGLFSLVMASTFNDAQVHAFDPIKLNNTLLSSSTEINGLKNIIINETCVGDFDGVVEFSIAEDSAYSSIRDSGRKAELKKIKLPILKLDTYIQQEKLQKIDFIKIDVEGAERLVIEGATQLFSSSALRPRLMMIELCDRNLRAFNTSLVEVIELMISFDYKPYVLHKDSLIEFKNNKHANIIENIFFKDTKVIKTIQ